jgi:putative glutamine transport system substrate-binding protein
MKYKLLIIVGLFFLVLLSGCSKTENNSDLLDKIIKRDKLIIGVKSDIKPFGYINKKNELEGFDIDLAKYVAKSILGDENKIEFKQVDSYNRILILNSSQVDMLIATMSITQQRKKIIDFSIPYYIAGQAILVSESSKINTIKDLNGKKVIVVFGSTAENNIRLMLPEVNIIGFKTYTKASEAMKKGYADAMVADDTILTGFVMDNPSFKILPKRYTKEPYAIGFKKGNEAIKLKNKINLILENMKNNGELFSLKEKWL